MRQTHPLSLVPINGTISDQATSNPNPAINVPIAPANATLQLLRDNVVVNTLSTGPNAGPVAITDNTKGSVPVGNHKYEVIVARAGSAPISLGQLPVEVVAPEPTTQPTAPTAPALALQGELLRSLFSQAGVLSTTPAPAPAPTSTSPTVLPSTSSQVVLNQYFGKAKVAAGSSTDAAPRRFSLFHHKDKQQPSVKTINVAGLSTALAGTPPPGLMPPAATAGGLGTVLPAVAPTTIAPTTTPSGLNTTPSTTSPAGVIPGTGT